MRMLSRNSPAPIPATTHKNAQKSPTSIRLLIMCSRNVHQHQAKRTQDNIASSNWCRIKSPCDAQQRRNAARYRRNMPYVAKHKLRHGPATPHTPIHLTRLWVKRSNMVITDSKLSKTNNINDAEIVMDWVSSPSDKNTACSHETWSCWGHKYAMEFIPRQATPNKAFGSPNGQFTCCGQLPEQHNMLVKYTTTVSVSPSPMKSCDTIKNATIKPFRMPFNQV